MEPDARRLPLRMREILSGSASGGSEKILYSSTYPHNGLMRRC